MQMIKVLTVLVINMSKKSNDDLEDMNDKMNANLANIAGGKVFACQMCDYKAGKKVPASAWKKKWSQKAPSSDST